ncbi:MAG: 2-C-methyl-D-erythritol 4-phosphate cytidylyltransferase [Flavobacteriales bacterium]|nr:2-C-methyl-D-erythritol 4-phosphate cytidylyltransferase [Flavobacteriales bacterium]
MERSAVIVAGGLGKRMGASIPKQFMLLKGKPVLCHTIDAFRAYDATMQIVVVLPEAQVPIWKSLCIGHGFLTEHEIVAGGEERFHSVQNGLAKVDHNGLVAVHDGVRPLVSVGLIDRCFEGAETIGSAIPVVTLSSSIRQITSEGSRALDRSTLRAVQTPQCFKTDILRKAFELPYDKAFTDEATLVERLGQTVHLLEGDDANIKITTPIDLNVAEALVA